MSWREDPAGPYIRTRSGVKFCFLNPTPELVRVEDILYTLPHEYRYCNHTRYSVAQHCVVGAWLADLFYSRDDGDRFLIHDFAEAYFGDVSSPLKSLLPDFKRVTRPTEKAIEAKFGVQYLDNVVVHEIDTRIWVTESRHFFPSHPEDPDDKIAPFTGYPPHWFTPWTADHATRVLKSEIERRFPGVIC